MSEPTHLDDILYPPIEPYETGELHRRRRPPRLLGAERQPRRQAGRLPARRARARAPRPGTGGSSTPSATASCCSTSAAAGASRRTRASRTPTSATTRRGTSSPTWSCCAATSASRGGRSSADRGAARSRSPTPRRTRTSVSELVLRGIFTLRRHELEWFYEGGASVIFPDLWEEFIAPIPVLERSRLIEAYHRRLERSRSRRARARRRRVVAMGGGDAHPAARRRARRGDDRARRRDRVRPHREPLLPARRLVRRRAAHRRMSTRSAASRRVIVQGRYDVCTPIMTAWDLHRAWPEAELVVRAPMPAHSATRARHRAPATVVARDRPLRSTAESPRRAAGRAQAALSVPRMRSAATSPMTIARRVGVAADQRRDDRRIGDAQTLDPADAQLGVDDGCGIRPHPGRADRVVERVRVAPQRQLGALLRRHALAALGLHPAAGRHGAQRVGGDEALALREAGQQRRLVDAVGVGEVARVDDRACRAGRPSASRIVPRLRGRSRMAADA